MANEQEEQMVEIALIDPPDFNSRINADPERVDALAASMGSKKQLEAIGVEGPLDGRYKLVFGDRRRQAAIKLGWTHIRATVRPLTDEKTRLLDNGIENLQREGLTTFETGRYCAKLRAVGFKGKEIQRELGLSESYISNVAICFEMLPDNIKAEWQKGHPAADVAFLRGLVNHKVDGKTVGRTPEEMTAMWADRVNALKAEEGELEDDEDEDDADEKADKPTPPPAPFKVPRKRYRAILKALNAGKFPKIATDALRLAVGEIQKVKGLDVEVDDA